MHVTAKAWDKKLLQHDSYGSQTSYQRAAQWLARCRGVADWGGSTGHLGRHLPASVAYHVVDGTLQHPSTVLADLATYTTPTDGIALRHVLDCTFEWAAVLRNAIRACESRLVVITFTPDADVSHIEKLKSGWPVWHFNPNDLRAFMRPFLVREEMVTETHPERIYYLERPCVS